MMSKKIYMIHTNLLELLLFDATNLFLAFSYFSPVASYFCLIGMVDVVETLPYLLVPKNPYNNDA